MAKKTKILGVKKDTFFSLLTWIVLAVIVYLLLGFKSGNIGDKECPDTIEGNLSAILKIKYFYTPYCVWCWIEAPILERLVENKGNLFNLEKYDLNYCGQEGAEYGISGVPAFVFSMENGTKEYPSMGFIDENNLVGIVCKLSGGC